MSLIEVKLNHDAKEDDMFLPNHVLFLEENYT